MKTTKNLKIVLIAILCFSILASTALLSQQEDKGAVAMVDFDKTELETNSDLFKINVLDGNEALYIVGNKYSQDVDPIYDKIADDIFGKVALFDKPRYNYTVEAELKFLGNHVNMKGAGWLGLAFRAQDTENYELIMFMPNAEKDTVAYIPIAHGIVPWWTEAYSTQRKGQVNIPSDKWFTVRIDILRDKFSVYVNNEPLFTKKITYYLKKGRPGFYVGTGTDAAIRNVSIKTLKK